MRRVYDQVMHSQRAKVVLVAALIALAALISLSLVLRARGNTGSFEPRAFGIPDSIPGSVIKFGCGRAKQTSR